VKADQFDQQTREMLYMTYVTEKQSNHPIAKAIFTKLELILEAFLPELEEKFHM